MSRKAKLIQQAFYAAASNLMQLMAFVLIVLVGKYLGPTGLGLFSYAQSLAMIVLSFANFGLATLTTRDVAKDHALAPRYFSLLVPWVASLAVVAGLVMVGIVAFDRAGDTEALLICAVVGAMIGLRVVGLVLRGLFQGLQRFGYEARALALENLVMLPVGVLLLEAGYGLFEFVIGLLIARAAGIGFMLIGLSRLFRLRPVVKLRDTWALQRQALTIGLSQNIHFASIHIDTVLLAWFLPVTATAVLSVTELRDAEIGQYNAAFRVYVGAMLVPMLAVSLLLPKLSASMLGTKRNHNALLLAGIGGMGLMGLLAVAVGYPLSPWGIELLFGPEFGQAVPVMRLLLFAMIPSFQFFFMNSYLVVIGRNRAYLAVVTIGFVVRVVVGVTLMQWMGIRGAAIGVIVAESVAVCCIWAHLLRVHFKPGPPAEVLRKLREALSAMALRS